MIPLAFSTVLSCPLDEATLLCGTWKEAITKTHLYALHLHIVTWMNTCDNQINKLRSFTEQTDIKYLWVNSESSEPKHRQVSNCLDLKEFLLFWKVSWKTCQAFAGGILPLVKLFNRLVLLLMFLFSQFNCTVLCRVQDRPNLLIADREGRWIRTNSSARTIWLMS